MKKILGVFLAVVIILLVGFGIGSVSIVPDRAIVYIDNKTNVFYSPLSLTQEKINQLHLQKSTFGQAKDLGFEVNIEDRENGYFEQKGRSLTGMLLEKIGLLPELPDRVDSEGNWRY